MEVRPGVFVEHSLAEYARLWRGVDREAVQGMVKPIEEEQDA